MKHHIFDILVIVITTLALEECFSWCFLHTEDIAAALARQKSLLLVQSKPAIFLHSLDAQQLVLKSCALSNHDLRYQQQFRITVFRLGWLVEAPDKAYPCLGNAVSIFPASPASSPFSPAVAPLVASPHLQWCLCCRNLPWCLAPLPPLFCRPASCPMSQHWLPHYSLLK